MYFCNILQHIQPRVNLQTMIYGIVRFIFVVLVFWLASCSPSHQQAEEYYNQAIDLSQKGKDAEAIQLLEKAVKLDDEYFKAWYALGTINYHSGIYYKAIDAFKKAVELESEDYLANNYLGLSRARVGKFAEAIPNFEAAIEVCPDTLLPGETHTNLAASLVQTGNIQRALDFYKSGLDILVRSANPKDREIVHSTYYDAANSIAGAGALSSALPLYTMAIAIKPDFKEAMHYLAFTYFNLGQPDSAEKYWYKAISIDSAFYMPYGGLSKLRRTQKRTPEANNFLGLSEVYQGNIKVATAHFQNAILGNPAFGEAYYNLGLASAEIGNYSFAQTNLKKAMALLKDSHSPTAALSYMNTLQKNKTDSIPVHQSQTPNPIEKSFMF